MKVSLSITILLFAVSCNAQQDNDTSKFNSRADIILSYAADQYELPKPNYSDPEKVYWPAVIARLSKYGIEDSLANSLLDDPVFKRKLPFHFILVGMARIMPLFPDAPAMRKNKLIYLENVANRKDSYNPWTCEGTENHINMSRTSGYIFAEQMLDYPRIFPDAEQKRLLMKDWLKYYANRIYEVGTGEFNASTYGVFNIIGFLNLYDFARDPEVKEMARAVLDYYACELALHHYQGMTSGAESRGAPSMKSLAHETEWLSWLWFGGITKARKENMFSSNRSKVPLQTVHAATSTYRPHRKIIELNTSGLKGENWYVNSKPSYMLAWPAYIKDFLFQNSSFSLGSASYPYGAYGTSAYKNTTWKLILHVNDSKENPDMITGGGGYYEDRKGMIRNPYTQVAQYKNVLIMMNLLPENYQEIESDMRTKFSEWRKQWEVDFVLRFSENDEKITHVGNPVKFLERNPDTSLLNSAYIWYSKPLSDTLINNILFLEYEKAYVVVRSMNQLSPMRRNEGIIVDHSPAGMMCGLILEAIEKDKIRNQNNFTLSFQESNSELTVDQTECSLNYKSYMGDEIFTKFTEYGSFTEPIYDWGFGPDTASHIQTAPPYLQPEWPEGKGFGRVPEVRVNGKRVYDKKKLPVYSGSNLLIDKNTIIIKDREGKHLINSVSVN